jgi:hypothetical protein
MVTELCGVSVDEFAAWTTAEDGRFFLVTSALQAAYNAKTKQKIRGLAKVLAENLHDTHGWICAVLLSPPLPN